MKKQKQKLNLKKKTKKKKMSLFNKLQNRFRKNTVKDLQNEKPQEETEVFFKKNLNLKYLNSLSFSFLLNKKGNGRDQIICIPTT